MNWMPPFVLIAALTLSLEAVAVTPLEQGIAAFRRDDTAKAIQILQPLAARGDVQAQYYLGLSHEYTPEAAQWFQKAAEQGHARAQYFLYSFYRDGIGVAQDPVQAGHWLRKAAASGDDSAQYSLGVETGDPQWYRLAAAQGHDKAQLALGWLYRDGKGVQRDFVRAYMWLWLSAQAGNATAREEVAYIEQNVLTAQELGQAHAKAKTCKRSGFKRCD